MEKHNKLTVYFDATLLDCLGGEPIYPAWLLTENDLIKEIGQGASYPRFSSAEYINCRGNTLMPGLIDAHIHGSFYENDMSDLYRLNYPGLQFAKAFKIYKDTLLMGITTARDCGGVDAGVREAIAQGLILGPRLTVSGPSISMTGGHADPRLGTEIMAPVNSAIQTGYIADGVPEVQKAAREILRRGVDHLKVMAGGGCASAGDEPDSSQYTPEELKAIVFEADAVNKKVIAHCYSPRSMELAANAGIHSIEHGNYMDEKTALLLKEKGCWYVPTMTTYEVMSSRGEEFGLSEFFLRKMKQVREKSAEAVALAAKAGVMMGSGSDVVGSGQPYKTMELELKARVLGNLEAILTATRNNAKLMGLENLVGTLQPNLKADLLLIEGNPLEDITLFQDPEKGLAIVKDGVFFKKSDKI
jgi:imidazolonepropionase-like amidohydrolase